MEQSKLKTNEILLLVMSPSLKYRSIENIIDENCTVHGIATLRNKCMEQKFLVIEL